MLFVQIKKCCDYGKCNGFIEILLKATHKL